MHRFFLFALLLALPVNARCSPWRGPRVTIGAAGERLCAKHHRPLATVTLYGPGNGVCVLVQPNKETATAREASPNALPFDLRREKNQLYSRAVEVSYCDSCERDVAAAREKHAPAVSRAAEPQRPEQRSTQ